MAARTATKDGNWSDVSVWDGGASLPGAADTADSNGYTVTIDQNIEVTTLIGTNAGAGGFAVSGAYTIDADITATVRTVLTCSAGAGVTVTIIGNITGGTASGMKGVVHSGVGTINVTGSVTGGSAPNARGISNDSTGTVNVDGNVTGGSSGTGAHNSTGGTVVITGTVTAGGGVGANNQSLGTLTARRAKAGGNERAVVGAVVGGTTRVTEIEFVCPMVGSPIGGYCKVLPDSTKNVVICIRSDTDAALPMSWDYPAVGDVKSGTVYALSTKTGTLGAADYPAEADVEFGVTYDSGGKTGAFVVPAEANVKAAVTYGAAAEFTGSLAAGGGGMLKGEKRGGKQ